MALFEPSHPPFWCPPHSPFTPLYDAPLYFMTGPTRTARTHPSTSTGTQPPRPPNAWILYRSDKLKDLPPPPPGRPRPAQADISKTISSMWKAETPAIRAHYERLSDIRKAEHNAQYPGYRFQPMKKADKDRLRAEKAAERERERGARKGKARARTSAGATDPPPLFTTAPRDDAPQASSSGAAPTPPPQHPTPRATPPPAPPSPAVYPAAPAPPTATPPLLAPQPGVPLSADWPEQQDYSALWALPDFSEYAAQAQEPQEQEYLTVPLPPASSGTPQFPLGWSPDDPAPASDVPFFPAQAYGQQQQQDPLHAVLSATADPNVFDLGDFDVNELFDGTREIEVSMGANMLPSAFVDMNQYSAFANGLFWDLDEPQFDAGLQQQQQQDLDLPQFGDLVQYVDVPEETAALRTPTPTPPAPAPAPLPMSYAPPVAGSNNMSRRVAADWRHIRLSTPEPTR